MTTPDSDFLTEEYIIDTPENVTFRYEVVGIGSRFIGALVDTLIIGGAMTALGLVTAIVVALVAGFSNSDFFSVENTETDLIVGLLIMGYALLNFVLLWGYYIVFELIWNGQTPGKRVAKTRVIRMDGQPIGLLENVVRNLVRIIDFLPSAYLVGLITMLCNTHARRLGDFAAGTVVVKADSTLSADDLLDSQSELFTDSA